MVAILELCMHAEIDECMQLVTLHDILVYLREMWFIDKVYYVHVVICNVNL